MKKIAFITGATAGIGEATARRLATHCRLILCGRRKERLELIQKELSKQTEVQILSFDVRDQKAVFDSVNSLPESWKDIDILVNNAGNAYGLDPIQNGNIEDWEL